MLKKLILIVFAVNFVWALFGDQYATLRITSNAVATCNLVLDSSGFTTDDFTIEEGYNEVVVRFLDSENLTDRGFTVDGTTAYGAYHQQIGHFEGNTMVSNLIDMSFAPSLLLTVSVYSNISDATVRIIRMNELGTIYTDNYYSLKQGWNDYLFDFTNHDLESVLSSHFRITGIGYEENLIYNTTNLEYDYTNQEFVEKEVELTFENKILHSDWNWESFPKLNRTDNSPVRANNEFDSLTPSFTSFEWMGKHYLAKEYNQWSEDRIPLQSTDGGRLKALPEAERHYVANGTRLDPATSITLEAGWNWIGYWLPHSQNINIAFGEHWDKVWKIKSENWYFLNEPTQRGNFDPVQLPSHTFKPLHYGEGYYVYLEEAIDNFSWFNEETVRSDNFEKKEPVSFTYDKKADYEVIDVVNIDPEIAEIGVFENDICVGGVTVDEESEQILVYSNNVNRENVAFTFQVVTNGNRAKTAMQYQTYNAKKCDFEPVEVISGKQNYSIVKFSKTGDAVSVNTSKIKHKSYPNPFNPKTTIFYDLPKSGKVDVSIYNVKGQKICTLIQEHQEKGEHQIVWDGTSNQDKMNASGIFFYKISTSTESVSGKLILLK